MGIVSSNADARALLGPVADRHPGDGILAPIAGRQLDVEANVLGGLFNAKLAATYAPRISADLFDDPLRRDIANEALAAIQAGQDVNVLSVGTAIRNNGHRHNDVTIADEMHGLLNWADVANEHNVEMALRQLIDRKHAVQLQYEARAVADLLQHGRIGPAEVRARTENLHATQADEVSFLPRPIGLEGGRNESGPVPLSELGGEGEAVDWLWRGYLARGAVTLLAGYPKKGKTTLLAHVLAAAGEGGNLVTDIAPLRAVIVSEEAKSLWAERRDRIGIGDHVEAWCRPFKGRPSRSQWEGLIDRLAALIRDREFALVVLDTFAGLSPVTDENDAAVVQTALAPLHRLAEAGAAVCLIHHLRKGDGSEGQGSRGSSAFTAFADIVVELRGYDRQDHRDNRRTLRVRSRYDEPDEAVVELRDGGYHFIGGHGDARQTDRSRVIAELLPTTPPGYTAGEVRERWDGETPRPGESIMHEDLKHGSDIGLWEKAGQGVRGDPFRYYRRGGGEP